MRKSLLSVPAEHFCPGNRAARADEEQRKQLESRCSQSRAGDARLQRFDRIAAGEEP